MSGSLTQCLPDAVRRLSAHISTVADTEQEQPLWETARTWLQAVTRSDWSLQRVIEEIAQALVCMEAYRIAQGAASLPPQARQWLRENANPFWQKIYQLPVVKTWLQTGRLPEQLALEQEFTGKDTLSFEDFLADYDADSRTGHGVFYTPVPVVRWMIQAVDQQVQETFPGTTGLVPGEAGSGRGGPGIDILDPAAGTGVFLVEVIQQVAGTMQASWRKENVDAADANTRWNTYVCDSLLPRLTGFELMLPAALLGQWVMMHKLAETGFVFRQPGNLQFHVVDTMAEPLEGVCQEPQELADYLRYLEQLRLERPFNVVLGNPPFSGISMNDVPWMGRLMRGQAPAGTTGPETPLSNYYQVQGEPLGERKVWLQDDYVKFLRYCHWKVEQAGCGMVGLVTNHGYLDGPSFRGLRQSLCETFTRIKILDLHGNQKKKECSPDGSVDQNVFPISSGIAVGLFFRDQETNRDAVVEHRDLWGTASRKLAALDAGVTSSHETLEPAPPHYFLLPHDCQLQDEYLAGFSLCDVMQERTTAAVTARDRFVVGFSEAEILERLESFRDANVTDEELRREFFTNSRSSKYPPGDTRGWKLTAARARVAADPEWKNRLQRCFYRPFDRRSIYWAPWMIDWPRTAVMKHMVELPNLAIVARRQMLPSRPCNFFWVTDSICLDGMIRSDNRGSESIFPLYTRHDETGQPQANVSDSLIGSLENLYQWRWLPGNRGDLQQTCGSLDWFYMVYAQFHSGGYRQRYAPWLRIDFPRVFLPRQRELFRLLVAEGERLVQLHLMRGDPSAGSVSLHEQEQGKSLQGKAATGRGQVAASFPRHENNRVWINPVEYFSPVSADVWEFEVGGHQVCRKWLVDRRGRELTQAEREQYAGLVLAVLETMDRMVGIDQAIDQAGGWPAAFQGRALDTDAWQPEGYREIA